MTIRRIGSWCFLLDENGPLYVPVERSIIVWHQYCSQHSSPEGKAFRTPENGTRRTIRYLCSARDGRITPMPNPEIAPPALAITLFGPIQVRVHGVPMPATRSRKVLCLLALLTLRHDR